MGGASLRRLATLLIGLGSPRVADMAAVGIGLFPSLAFRRTYDALYVGKATAG